MASNKKKIPALMLAALALFLAGGWFFTSLPRWRAPQGEVEELYSENGESFGIFDNIPPEELAAAEAAAAYGLNEEIVLPEDAAASQRRDGAELPTQIALTDAADIASVAPVEKREGEEEEQNAAAVPLHLSGAEVTIPPGQDISALPERESKITLIAAPVSFLLVKDAASYKKFKTRARGSYPDIDFGRQMLVVLESQSNIPDNAFEIESASVKDGKLKVLYRVNVFDLEDKINTHTAAAVDRTDAEVELEQIP